jgi:hypothetical protein
MSSILLNRPTVLHVKETFILTNIAAVTNHNLGHHLARIVAGNAGLFSKEKKNKTIFIYDYFRKFIYTS